jgi:hypothetical protein
MSNKVAELTGLVGNRDSAAEYIGNLWHTWNTQRDSWVEEQKELRDFLFATDTSTTSNQSLPWKNRTTLPKLTQIRDNLHANYMAALFPNDEWVRWESYSLDPKEQQKSKAIQAYIQNKTRQSNFRTTVDRLVLDYIDYGNAFADVEFISTYKTDLLTGEQIPDYIGPRLIRISPLDIVFDPTVSNFKDSPKIVRSIKTIGELKTMAEDNPEDEYLKDALDKRLKMKELAGLYTVDDFDKAVGYSVDGFGNIYEYYQSNYIEILEFHGDYYDSYSDTLYRDKVITIADRTTVLRNTDSPEWSKGSTIEHVGWRPRTDNLWSMGPLNNLVGMQYRIDHLENLKADVFDLIAYPPLKIIGDVDEFDWGPGEEIHIDENGDVQMLVPDTTALNADFQIQLLEEKMELYAGAPKQAMGIRTPGEKTAFEVQSLDNAAGRIFQIKTTNFELNLIEACLNNMLESSRRNMPLSDIVRVMDDDLGVEAVIAVSREDIISTGKLKPIGARHFAAQAQLVQNLNGVFSSAVGELVRPHTSSKQMSKLIEDVLGLKRFELFQDNINIFEQAETQRLVNQIQEDLAVEQDTSLEEEEGDPNEF